MITAVGGNGGYSGGKQFVIAEQLREKLSHLCYEKALIVKLEFDAIYGPAWHCIVGKSFGSFVTHSTGGFVYFSIDKLSFLLFKTVVRPVKSPPLLLKLNK
nr:dynein light chain, cytoplasmic [Quercus suber]